MLHSQTTSSFSSFHHRRPPCMKPLRNYTTWTWWFRNPSGCTQRHHGRHESFFHIPQGRLFACNSVWKQEAICTWFSLGTWVAICSFQSGNRNTQKMNAIAGRSAKKIVWWLCISPSGYGPWQVNVVSMTTHQQEVISHHNMHVTFKLTTGSNIAVLCCLQYLTSCCEDHRDQWSDNP